MTVHELTFGSRKNSLNDRYRVFVLPRSADPQDYALVSPIDERTLLKRGIEGHLEFHGYRPILESVEAKVKEFLHGKILKGRQRNFRIRQAFRWGSALGIISCLLFMFSGFIDDLLLDPLFLGIIAFTFIREFREQRILNDLQRKIETIRFVENPLLTTLFEQFSGLAGPGPVAVDWQTVADSMPHDHVRSTIGVISDYTRYDERRSLERRLSSFSVPASNSLWENLLARVASWYSQRHSGRLGTLLRDRCRLGGGYLELCDYLIEALSDDESVEAPGFIAEHGSRSSSRAINLE